MLRPLDLMLYPHRPLTLWQKLLRLYGVAYPRYERVMVYLGKIVPNIPCAYQCENGHGCMMWAKDDSFSGVHVFRFQGALKCSAYYLLERCLLLSKSYEDMVQDFGLAGVTNQMPLAAYYRRAEPVRFLLQAVAPAYKIGVGLVTPDAFTQSPLFERVV